MKTMTLRRLALAAALAAACGFATQGADAATRTVSFAASDGTKTSSAATKSVTVAAVDQTPIVTTTGGSTSFATGSGPVAVDAGVTVTDADNTTLANAAVSITGGFLSGEDVLAFSNPGTFGNITASYNSSTGVLTLTSSGASATLAQWQAALQAVTYDDTAATPSGATSASGTRPHVAKYRSACARD